MSINSDMQSLNLTLDQLVKVQILAPQLVAEFGGHGNTLLAGSKPAPVSCTALPRRFTIYRRLPRLPPHKTARLLSGASLPCAHVVLAVGKNYDSFRNKGNGPIGPRRYRLSLFVHDSRA